MINDQPRIPPGQYPAGNRFVLPGDSTPSQTLHEEQTQQFQAGLGARPMSSAKDLRLQMIRHNSRWRNDPVYKVLLAAVILMILSSVVFAAVATNVLQQMTNGGSDKKAASAYQTAPAQDVQQGAVDTNPTFPPPGSTPGNTKSSLPPKSGTPTLAAPTATPTSATQPTPTATQPPQNTTFTIQIVDYPQQVDNNTTAQIQVKTEQPSAILQLNAQYALPPFVYQSGQIADANGNATFYVPIELRPFGLKHQGRTSIARMIIRGQLADGRQTSSQTITIQVNLQNGVAG